ncbi:MAG: SpoIID/LytB domain-containing protein [Planctomycetota bacterium]|nr:MAG: SpoIID/LytB domain-containing protein [Planctomycetota bacterium]
MRATLVIAVATWLALAACGAPAPRSTPPAREVERDVEIDSEREAHAPSSAAPVAPPLPAQPTPTPPPRRARVLPTLPVSVELEHVDSAHRSIERLDLDEYVTGVLRGELVVWDAPSALLEAQAIASRSYALAVLELRAQQGRSGPLPNSTAAQAYRGAPAGKLSPAAHKVEARVRAAVAATRGRVLVADGCVLDARFHACCGGATAAFADVFAAQEDLGAMPSVACAGCAGEPAWKATLERAELARVWNVLGLAPKDWTLAPARRDARGRWLEVELGSKGKSRRMPFEELRARIGAARIPSSRIYNEWPDAGAVIDAKLVLEGRGRGHGVGLCQAGARHEAERGATSAEILARYFPGAKLVTLR